jgi:hypothetical protein
MEKEDIDMRHGNVETWRHGQGKHGYGDMDMESWTWSHGHMESWNYCKILGNSDFLTKILDGKRKPRRFSSIRSLFAHHANGSLSFAHLLTKKQTEVIPLQMD